jgi:parallel beta-helix repeat protein
LLIPMILVPVVWAFIPSAAQGVSSAGCGIVVRSGESIQAALRSEPSGATVCVTSGSFDVRSPLRPRAHQTIRGIGSPPPTITCDTAFCVDGSAGPGHVSLLRLTLTGADDADIRAGNNWVISDVEARSAGAAGISVRGSGVSITRSYIHDNGKVGINAVDVAELSIVETQVAFNPTNPTFGIGHSGGLKLNDVNGLLLQGDHVHDNGGGAGIWLDIDSRNFELKGNRVIGSSQDGIRVEISCRGTLEGNTIMGSGGTGMDLFNSRDVTITSNIVSTPPGAGASIRMLGTGRTTSVGTGSCKTEGEYDNVDNHAAGNSITMTDATTLAGILSAGGFTARDSWSGTTFIVPDCAALQWRWWDGRINRKVDFGGWQGLGQDLTGSCDRSDRGSVPMENIPTAYLAPAARRS